MKTTYTNMTVLLTSLAFLSLPASAGLDSTQRLMLEQAIKQQQQTKVDKQQSDAIKLEECKKLIEKGKNANGS